MNNMSVMQTGFDLITSTFDETKILGINWLASIILIFITMIIISRQTQVWQYLALSVTMAWSKSGLNVPDVWYMGTIIMFTITLLTSRIIQDRIKAIISTAKTTDEAIIGRRAARTAESVTLRDKIPFIGKTRDEALELRKFESEQRLRLPKTQAEIAATSAGKLTFLQRDIQNQKAAQRASVMAQFADEGLLASHTEMKAKHSKKAKLSADEKYFKRQAKLEEKEITKRIEQSNQKQVMQKLFGIKKDKEIDINEGGFVNIHKEKGPITKVDQLGFGKKGFKRSSFDKKKKSKTPILDDKYFNRNKKKKEKTKRIGKKGYYTKEGIFIEEI